MNVGSGWNIATLKEHFEALRASDQRALQIKEEGDTKALNLQNETQKYKDEKANELREQINRERLLYATKSDVVAAVEKIEAIVKPIATYTASQQGRVEGSDKTWQVIVTIIGVGIALAGFISIKG